MNKEKVKSGGLAEEQIPSSDAPSASEVVKLPRQPMLGYYPAEERVMLEKGMAQLTDRPVVHQALRQVLAKRGDRSEEKPDHDSGGISGATTETGISDDSGR